MEIKMKCNCGHAFEMPEIWTKFPLKTLFCPKCGETGNIFFDKSPHAGQADPLPHALDRRGTDR